jgi:dihydroxyacetone kinase
MALEQAAAEGYKCKMIIVEDDCALPVGKGITGGRGVAGTLFVHKVRNIFVDARRYVLTA